MARTQINQSFVARIWFESSKEQSPEWRGHIQHIQGTEELYFRDLSQMTEFMEEVSGVRGMDFNTRSDKIVSIHKQEKGTGKRGKIDK